MADLKKGRKIIVQITDYYCNITDKLMEWLEQEINEFKCDFDANRSIINQISTLIARLQTCKEDNHWIEITC